ncbi:MAG: hypothetical protein LUG95_01000 [Clostridiales bacterium]|nr:hypothetical protein [Clostridiales bacterium]
MFDFKNELNSIYSMWCSFCLRLNNAKQEFTVYVPKGCGGTKIAAEYVCAHSSAFYLAFDGLTDRLAVESFREQFLPEAEYFNDWDEAVTTFIKKRNMNNTMLIFENNGGCYEAFKKYIRQTDYIQICLMSGTAQKTRADIEIGYRTLQDYFRAFTNYNRQEILRLYALTGGLYSVAKEIDENLSFEENVKTMLEYDSVYSTTVPIWLTEAFRKPESYYPILKSIASGNHRLSEIAKDIEFPNNKCGKYLEALIEHNFVIAKKSSTGKQSTYHLANPYIKSWAKFILGKRSMQIAQPEKFYEYVMNSLDEEIALPAFYDACKRFTEQSHRDYLVRYRSAKIESKKKSVSVKFQNGLEIVFDYCVQTDDELFVFILPKSLDDKFTKNEITDIYEALKMSDLYYNTHIIIFSVNCFSDWCVHEAARNRMLHEVPLEQLKY